MGGATKKFTFGIVKESKLSERTTFLFRLPQDWFLIFDFVLNFHIQCTHYKQVPAGTIHAQHPTLYTPGPTLRKSTPRILHPIHTWPVTFCIYIPQSHSVLFTLGTFFFIPHFSFQIPLSANPPPQFLFRIVQCAVHTSHSTSHTVQATSLHQTPHTPDCIPQSPGFFITHTAQFIVDTVHPSFFPCFSVYAPHLSPHTLHSLSSRSPHILHCTLTSPQIKIHPTYCTPNLPHFTLFSQHFFFTSHYTLHTLHFSPHNLHLEFPNATIYTLDTGLYTPLFHF